MSARPVFKKVEFLKRHTLMSRETATRTYLVGDTAMLRYWLAEKLIDKGIAKVAPK